MPNPFGRVRQGLRDAAGGLRDLVTGPGDTGLADVLERSAGWADRQVSRYRDWREEQEARSPVHRLDRWVDRNAPALGEAGDALNRLLRASPVGGPLRVASGNVGSPYSGNQDPSVPLATRLRSGAWQSISGPLRDIRTVGEKVVEEPILSAVNRATGIDEGARPWSGTNRATTKAAIERIDTGDMEGKLAKWSARAGLWALDEATNPINWVPGGEGASAGGKVGALARFAVQAGTGVGGMGGRTLGARAARLGVGSLAQSFGGDVGEELGGAPGRLAGSLAGTVVGLGGAGALERRLRGLGPETEGVFADVARARPGQRRTAVAPEQAAPEVQADLTFPKGALSTTDVARATPRAARIGEVHDALVDALTEERRTGRGIDQFFDPAAHAGAPGSAVFAGRAGGAGVARPIADLRLLRDAGLDYADWYPQLAAFIRDERRSAVPAGSRNEFATLWGVFARASSPRENLDATLNAMTVARRMAAGEELPRVLPDAEAQTALGKVMIARRKAAGQRPQYGQQARSVLVRASDDDMTATIAAFPNAPWVDALSRYREGRARFRELFSQHNVRVQDAATIDEAFHAYLDPVVRREGLKTPNFAANTAAAIQGDASLGAAADRYIIQGMGYLVWPKGTSAQRAAQILADAKAERLSQLAGKPLADTPNLRAVAAAFEAAQKSLPDNAAKDAYWYTNGVIAFLGSEKGMLPDEAQSALWTPLRAIIQPLTENERAFTGIRVSTGALDWVVGVKSTEEAIADAKAALGLRGGVAAFVDTRNPTIAARIERLRQAANDVPNPPWQDDAFVIRFERGRGRGAARTVDQWGVAQERQALGALSAEARFPRVAVLGDDDAAVHQAITRSADLFDHERAQVRLLEDLGVRHRVTSLSTEVTDGDALRRGYTVEVYGNRARAEEAGGLLAQMHDGAADVVVTRRNPDSTGFAGFKVNPPQGGRWATTDARALGAALPDAYVERAADGSLVLTPRRPLETIEDTRGFSQVAVEHARAFGYTDIEPIYGEVSHVTWSAGTRSAVAGTGPETRTTRRPDLQPQLERYRAATAYAAERGRTDERLARAAREERSGFRGPVDPASAGAPGVGLSPPPIVPPAGDAFYGGVPPWLARPLGGAVVGGATGALGSWVAGGDEADQREAMLRGALIGGGLGGAAGIGGALGGGRALSGVGRKLNESPVGHLVNNVLAPARNAPRELRDALEVYANRSTSEALDAARRAGGNLADQHRAAAGVIANAETELARVVRAGSDTRGAWVTRGDVAPPGYVTPGAAVAKLTGGGFVRADVAGVLGNILNPSTITGSTAARGVGLVTDTLKQMRLSLDLGVALVRVPGAFRQVVHADVRNLPAAARMATEVLADIANPERMRRDPEWQTALRQMRGLGGGGDPRLLRSLPAGGAVTDLKERAGTLFDLIPGVGPFLQKTAGQLEEVQYNRVLPSVKFRAWQVLRKQFGTDLATSSEIGRRVDVVVSGVDRIRSGRSQGGEFALRVLTLSPGWARGTATNIAQVSGTGLEGKLARGYWTDFALTATAISVGLSLAFSDHSPERLRELLDPRDPDSIVNPNGKNFLKVTTGDGASLNIWGPMGTLFKTVLKAPAAGIGEGAEALDSGAPLERAIATGILATGGTAPDAAWQWLHGRRNVTVGLVEDLARNTGQNRLPVMTADDRAGGAMQALVYAGKSLVPGSVAAVTQDEGERRPAPDWDFGGAASPEGWKRLAAAVAGGDYKPPASDPPAVKAAIRQFLDSQGIATGADPVGDYRRAVGEKRVGRDVLAQFELEHPDVPALTTARQQERAKLQHPGLREAVERYNRGRTQVAGARRDEVLALDKEYTAAGSVMTGDEYRKRSHDIAQRYSDGLRALAIDNFGVYGVRDLDGAQQKLKEHYGPSEPPASQFDRLWDQYQAIRPASQSQVDLEVWADARRAFIEALPKDMAERFRQYRRDTAATDTQRALLDAEDQMGEYARIPKYRLLDLPEQRRAERVLDKARALVTMGQARDLRRALLQVEGVADADFANAMLIIRAGSRMTAPDRKWYRLDNPGMYQFFSGLSGEEFARITAA